MKQLSSQQPEPSPAPSPTSPPPAPTGTEIVTRPEPGLARGKWEAPAWVFWVILALVLVATTAYVGSRLGLLRLRGQARTRLEDNAPPSKRSSARRP